MGVSTGYYFENDRIVWGDYSGGKIIKGHFWGSSHEQETINSKSNPLDFGSTDEKIKRAICFLNTYQHDIIDLINILGHIIIQLEWTIKLIENESKSGNSKFVKFYEDDHTTLYKNDINYCKELLKHLENRAI